MVGVVVIVVVVVFVVVVFVVLVLVLVVVVDGGGIFVFQEIQLSLFQRIFQISFVVVLSLHFCSVLRVMVVAIVVVMFVVAVIVVVIVIVVYLDIDMNICCYFYTSARSVHVSIVALSCFPMAHL